LQVSGKKIFVEGFCGTPRRAPKPVQIPTWILYIAARRGYGYYLTFLSRMATVDGNENTSTPGTEATVNNLLLISSLDTNLIEKVGGASIIVLAMR
jgi:hypothetical protein